MLQSYASGIYAYARTLRIAAYVHVHTCARARLSTRLNASACTRVWRALKVRKRPSPISTAHAESHRRESKGVAAHNAFPRRRRQRGKEERRKRRKGRRSRGGGRGRERRTRGENTVRRKTVKRARGGIRVSRAVRGSQYP